MPIDEIYADNRAEIDKWGRDHGRDTHDWNEKRRMTREWMAETGFKPERPGWWKQLISQIRVWLAEHGFGHLREADIETIIQDSFKAANRTNRSNRTNDGTRFALPEDVASFERSIEDYKSGKLNPYQTVQVTSHTPNVLLRLDLKDKGIRVADRKITISYGVIEKAIGEKASTSTKERHDLDLETLKKLPEQIHNPAMVLDSNTENSLEIYTTLFDQSNRPVMIALLLNKVQDIPGKRGGEYAVNSITSVYGKDNAKTAINRLFSGHGRYVHTKRIETWLRAAGVQSSGAGAFKSLPHTIVDDSENASENGDKSRFSVSPVWTGSAADYDQPSLNYVGTGEGAQVYGWGLYGSTSRGIGEEYAKADFNRKNPEDEFSEEYQDPTEKNKCTV